MEKQLFKTIIMSDRIEKIEKAIELLKPALTMINTGKEYQFSDEKELTYEERCVRVKQRLEQVQEIVREL